MLPMRWTTPFSFPYSVANRSCIFAVLTAAYFALHVELNHAYWEFSPEP